jgi:hypothetical protein
MAARPARQPQYLVMAFSDAQMGVLPVTRKHTEIRYLVVRRVAALPGHQ